MGISALFKSSESYAYHLIDNAGNEMVEEITKGKGKNETIEEVPYIFYFSNPLDNPKVKALTESYKKRKNPSDKAFRNYQKDVITESLTDWQIFGDNSKPIEFNQDEVSKVIENASDHLLIGAFVSVNDPANFTKGATIK